MAPTKKQNPLNTAGLSKLVKILSEETVAGVIDAVGKDCVAESTGSVKLLGDYGVDANGELLIAANAKTNLPTEPVAGDLAAKLRRMRSGQGQGKLTIHYTIRVRTKEPFDPD